MRAAATPAMVEHEVARTFPAVAQTTGLEGVRRLINYQNVPYAWLYLSRLRPIVEVDQIGGAQGKLLKEVARHLAVRMSYEDVVRVAQAKIAPARMQRIARDELHVTDRALFRARLPQARHRGVVPAAAAVPGAPILRMAERRGWLGRVYFGMEVNSTTVRGYLRFLVLAKLRRLRPFGYRYKQEQTTDRKLAGSDPGSSAKVTTSSRSRSPNARD